MGTLFIGIAFGPTLGSILIKFTQNLLTPFYVSVTVYMLMIPLYLLALPESLILVARASLTRKQHELREEHAEAPQQARASGRWHARQRFLALFRFLSPLAIFLPRMIDGTGRRDWNLLLVVISNGILFSHFCLIAYKTQYAIAVFGWHSEELGYWLSAGGITRALHNIVILPIIIKFLKPGTPAVALPPQQNEMEPLISRNTSPEPWAEAEEGTPAATPTHPPTPSSYAIARTDLMIARVSLLIDIASYTMVAMSGGPVLFFVGTVAMSFGGGFGPAASSLALHLSNGQESGKLFGAIAVANTIGSSLVGPAIFGMIYINTVGTFPKAIFVAAAASVAVAFGAMLLIRLPQEPLSKDVEDRVGDELQPQTLGAI
ncbi:hypothetical protein FRB96_002429 [Tulasnella sp. 330]|nr:hypothetical protein FRB96_002429 [Tulasnella sp. 330]